MPPKKRKLQSQAAGKLGGRKGSTNYSRLSESEKLKYHKKATRKCRKQSPTTPDNSASTSHSRSGERSRSRPQPRGRPPLCGAAMTPNTLKGHVRNRNKKRRLHEKRGSTARQNIAKRWSSEPHVTGDGRDDPWTGDDEQAQADAPDGQELAGGEDSVSSDPKLYSERTKCRYRARLVGLLPSDCLASIDHFFRCLPHFPDTECIQLTRVPRMSGRNVWYAAKKVGSLAADLRSEERTELLMYWIERMFADPLAAALFVAYNVSFPPQYTPRYIKACKLADSLKNSYLRRSHAKLCQHTLGTEFAIAVAREAGLCADVAGDIEVLAQAIGSTPKYGSMVLAAIASGTENSLLQRKLQSCSLNVTKWPAVLEEFVLQNAVNTRSVNGEYVSVAYGKRLPKHLLLKSKQQIIVDFKEKQVQENDPCNFAVSTLLRAFPANAVTPKHRDIERSACSTHTNMRRLLAALQKTGVGLGVSSSCRAMVQLAMCSSGSTDHNATDPTAWRRECAMGKCPLCPTPDLPISTADADRLVTVSLWRQKWCEIKRKQVFGLFPETKTVSAAIQQFGDMLVTGKKHIFTAHHQWNFHQRMRDVLGQEDITTVEDYQQNLLVEHRESPTSCHYASNQVTVALYPIGVEFRRQDGSLGKGAVCFLSDDKRHDNQQVCQFEELMFSILRTEQGLNINNWLRLSDGCASQFRSCFTNADLLMSKGKLNLKRITYAYYEANEGKNISDTIGSIVKCAFLRGQLKTGDQGVHSTREVVEVVRGELRDYTKKFDFFVVREVPPLQRIPANTRMKCPYRGIMLKHSIKLAHGNNLLLDELSCLECTVAELCVNCTNRKADIEVDCHAEGELDAGEEEETGRIEDVGEDDEYAAATDSDMDSDIDPIDLKK